MWSLFSKALSFTKEHFKHLSLIGFCTFGIFLLISAFGRPEWIDLTSFSWFIESSQSSANSGIISLLLNIGLSVWWWAIAYYVINASQYQTSLNGFIGNFWSRFFPTLWTGIIYGILAILLSLLFIIPWIIFGIYWFVATSVTLDNGPWWWAALRQSKEMTTGKWRDIFGINLWLGIIVWSITVVLMYVLYLVYQSFAWNPIMDIIFNATQYLIVIFMYVFGGLLYVHLKETFVPKTIETQSSTTPETPVTTPVA